MPSDFNYTPPPEAEGGWRIKESAKLGVDAEQLKQAVSYHNDHAATRSYGAALIILHKGHVIAENYVTGEQVGPQKWGRNTCNDIKSSTKSVFGTIIGVFLKEYGNRVTLETPLVGESRKESLLPQIWEQPLTDDRKTRILVKHALSMTSGHDSREPWLAPSMRRHTLENRRCA